MAESEEVTPEPSSEGQGRPRAVAVAVGLTIAALLASFLAALAVIVASIPLGYGPIDPPVVPLLIASQLGFFLTGYLYVRRYGLRIPFTLPSQGDVRYIIGGTVAALTFAIIAGIGLEAGGFIPDSPIEGLIIDEPTLAIWLAVLSIFVIAPIEEYLFRGVIQGRLRRSFGAPGAILIASLLFSSLHFANFGGSLAVVLAWTLLIAGIGVILGFLYERTETLIVPIAVHAIYNAVLFFAGYLTL